MKIILSILELINFSFAIGLFFDAINRKTVSNTFKILNLIDEFSSKDTFYCLHKCQSMPTCLSVEIAALDETQYKCVLMNLSDFDILSYKDRSDVYKKRILNVCPLHQYWNDSKCCNPKIFSAFYS